MQLITTARLRAAAPVEQGQEDDVKLVAAWASKPCGGHRSGLNASGFTAAVAKLGELDRYEEVFLEVPFEKHGAPRQAACQKESEVPNGEVLKAYCTTCIDTECKLMSLHLVIRNGSTKV